MSGASASTPYKLCSHTSGGPSPAPYTTWRRPPPRSTGSLTSIQQRSQLFGIGRWRLADVVLAYVGRRIAIAQLTTGQQRNRRVAAGDYLVREERLEDD